MKCYYIVLLKIYINIINNLKKITNYINIQYNCIFKYLCIYILKL